MKSLKGLWRTGTGIAVKMFMTKSRRKLRMSPALSNTGKMPILLLCKENMNIMSL